MIRAAAFVVDGEERGAVTLTLQAVDGFWMPLGDGAGVNATIALNPNEARGFAAWLNEAADAADSVGPPFYG